MTEPAQHPVASVIDRLLQVRTRLRWSQEEMGARLGLTTEAYRALEKGRTVRLEWETILLLMDLLDQCGLSVEWFFGRGKPGTATAPQPGAEIDPPSADSPVGIMHQGLDRVTAALLSEEAARPPLPDPVVKVPRARRKADSGGHECSTYCGGSGRARELSNPQRVTSCSTATPSRFASFWRIRIRGIPST